MPYRRPYTRYTSTYSRRGSSAGTYANRGAVTSYRRRNTAAKPRGVINRTAAINPDYYVTKLKYLAGPYFNDASASNFWVRNTFSCNAPSLMEPAGTSSQPDGWDQFAGLWLNYCVTGCKYKIHCHNVSFATVNGASNPRTIVVVPRMAGASLPELTSTTNVLAGQPYAKMEVVGSIYGENTATISGYISIAKMAGLKSLTVQAGYAAAVNAVPSNIVALDVYRGRPQDLAAPVGLSIIVELTVYCKFYGRRSTFDA